MLQPEELIARTLRVLEGRGVQAWLVGGWVRDRLLGRETHDIDFALPAEASIVARQVADVVGGAFVLLDVERDTARVIVGPRQAPVLLDFAVLRAPSIDADLLARDFTVNALAIAASQWNMPEPEIIDPTGGRRDLALGVLRAVSADAFREDPLRLLRAVRLVALLGFELESETAIWAERDAELLDAVSRERVRDELVLMMDLPPVRRSLELLDSLGLLAQVLPELAPRRAAAGPGEAGALEHTLRTVDALEKLRGWLAGGSLTDLGWAGETLEAGLGQYRAALAEHMAAILPGGRRVDTILMLAALLHEVGKEADGREGAPREARLLGHEVLSASLAATILRRLCFSSTETVRVRLAVRNRTRPIQLAQEVEGEPSRRAIYRFFQDAQPAGLEVILLSLADHLATGGKALVREHWQRHLKVSRALLAAYFERRQEVVDPAPLVDGREVMAAFGLAPGPEVGRLLDGIREAQAAGEVRSREEALQLAGRLLQRES